MTERELSTRKVSVARPTILVDGVKDERTDKLLLTLSLIEEQGGMSCAELRFSNWCEQTGRGADYAFEDEQLLRLGATLSVGAGDEDEDGQELFRGKVTGFEFELSHDAPPELVVLAEDALQRARMTRKTELYSQMTIADLAERVAQRAGLRPVVDGFRDDVGPQMQLNESDLAFLRRLLLAYDGDLQVAGEELHVSPREGVRRDSLTLLSRGQLSRARLTVDLAHQATEITVTGWDAERGRSISQTSRGRALGPGEGRRGSSLLEETLGPRSEHVGHVPVVSDREARLFAEAAFDQRARRFVLLEGTADGNPALRVGTHVKLEDMSPRFNNTFYVTRACHRYDQARGYLTDFEAQCAYLGEP